MYKVALQLYGKFRFFEFQKKYYTALKKIGKKNNIEIDIHLTTWKDEESTPHVKDPIFVNVNLIDYPKSGYKQLKYFDDFSEVLDDTDKRKSPKKTTCLFLAHYSLYKSYSNRKKWELENDKKYDLVICTRPDTMYPIQKFIDLFRPDRLKWKDSHILFIGQSSSPLFKGEYLTRSSADNLFYGAPQSIDLFCSSFNFFYRQEHNFYLSHHLNFAQACMVLNQITLPTNHDGYLVRSLNPQEDNKAGLKIPLKDIKQIENELN